MIKELITKDNDILKSRAIEFNVLANSQKDSIELLQDLGDTLESLEDRLYLTSNQIGKRERAFALKFNGETDVFMNPAFSARDKMIIFREKDPYDGKEYFIPRFTDVSLVFQDTLGQARGLKFNEAGSIVICQAMDALNGLYPSDYGLEILPDFDLATDEEKQEVLAEYIKSIESLYNQLDDELSNSEDTKNSWVGAKFLKAVSKGDVNLVEQELSNRKKKKLKKFLKDMKSRKNSLKH